MIILYDRLVELLKKNKITKSKMGEMLGISSRTIAKIAKKESLSNAVVEKIAEFLRYSIADLCTNKILYTLRKEKELKLSDGIYHMTQIKLTYNSNYIEGSKLTEDQTRYIFETQNIGEIGGNVKIDDVIETNNHFACINYLIDHAEDPLSENMIKELQKMLKAGTKYSQEFKIGEYKQKPNTVEGIETSLPENTAKEMKTLIQEYNSKREIVFEDIVAFHHNFERIHPFQDGNGRVGRLIIFKECLKYDIIPFIIEEDKKWFYYRGLSQWKNEKEYLLEACRAAQDEYKKLLDYFRI